MKVKEFKELINSFPDEWEIGYNEEYKEGPNVNYWIAKRFVPLNNINVDVKNKYIILYEN